MDKSAQLQSVYRACRELLAEVYRESPRIPVMGEGDPASPLMMIGEAPGEQETLQGRPFVGKAGKNLDEFLHVMEIERGDIYITNVVKFRPTKTHERTGSLSNRPPTKEEILLCRRFLMREIEIVNPQVIVTLGNTPLQAILQDKTVIGAVHGTRIPLTVEGVSAILFPLYHPASIIYNRSLAEVYRQDLQILKEFLRIQDIFPVKTLK